MSSNPLIAVRNRLKKLYAVHHLSFKVAKEISKHTREFVRTKLSFKKTVLRSLNLPRGERYEWEETQMPAADEWLSANTAQNFRDSKSKLGSKMSC